MSSRRTNARRSIGALLPLVLTASLLSSGTVIGQNGQDLPDISPAPVTIAPTAIVAVLGDGFLSAPSIAPIRPNDCATSTNGPIERAARQSPGTAVVVENVSCVGATLSSVGQQQVGQVDPNTDLVVLGGVGMEFDWDALAGACLGERTRSVARCQAEASVARATASNNFFSWRSLLQQVHRAAPTATIALVAPPQPVADTELRLGSQCCTPSVDAHEQVRSVFDAASALRGAVVDSLDDLPVVLVETTDAFGGHRMDSADSWLMTEPPTLGTPTAEGVDAIADLLDVLMPVGEPITGPPGAPAEVLVVLGTTEADEASHAAVQDAAEFWIETYRLSDVNPTVALIPIETSAPVPTTTTTTTTTTALPAVADASAPVEVDVDVDVEVEVEVEVAVEVPDEVEPATEAAPAVREPATALQVAETATAYASSGDELAAAIDELTTSDGVSSLADLAQVLETSPELFTPTVTDRRIVIRAVNLDVANASAEDAARLRSAIEVANAEVTLIASSRNQAAEFAALTEGTGAVIDSANANALPGALPAPVPNAQLTSVTVQDIDLANSQPGMAVAAVDVTRPTEATITWSLDDDVIASGQIASIDPARLGLGSHSVTVTVATERESISTTATVRVTIDGDAIVGDACRAFDPFPTDLDGDGLAAACDNDDDGDGIADAVDPCPNTVTTNLQDIDLDGLPNSCDADQLNGPGGDSDGDGFPDIIDNCPSVSQDDNQFDGDQDGIGNACEENTVTRCTIIGTEGDDIINGTAGNDVICGLGGDDRINGLGGDDLLLGGLGNDTLLGSGGNDRLIGGPGDDELSGHGDDDVIIGDAGNDTLNGGFGDDVLAGGRGADALDGDAGNDVLFGGRGDDVLSGGDGADTLSGEGGQDELAGEAGDDLLHGGFGADDLGGGRANDILIDVTSIDFARGGTGDDVIGADPLRAS